MGEGGIASLAMLSGTRQSATLFSSNRRGGVSARHLDTAFLAAAAEAEWSTAAAPPRAELQVITN
jgi:hypothetical protein